MKRTVIRYKKMYTGDIKIVSFENVANKEGLRNCLGDDVAEDYFAQPPKYPQPPKYLRRDNGDLQYDDGTLIWKFSPGDIISPERFGEMVSTLKRAGDRLQRIKKYHNSPEIREVVI